MWALHHWRFVLMLFYPNWLTTIFDWVDRDRITAMAKRAGILGREIMRRWFGDKLTRMKYLGEQNVLMWIIFTSRLMPFVSFDLVSYAAGLSNLKFWRFSLATIAGIVPASFLLAHFGREMEDGSMPSALWLVLGLGLDTGLPVFWAVFRRNRLSGS